MSKKPSPGHWGQIGRMQFERTTRKITASREDWKLLRRIVKLRRKTDVPPLGLWRAVDDEFLWARIVSQICNRGGVGWGYALNRSGRRKEFDERLSLTTLRTLPSEPGLEKYIAEQLDEFHVGRFRKDNMKSIVDNLATFMDSGGRLSELRNRLDELDSTADIIGLDVQERERKARRFLMERLAFYQNGKKFRAKRKPASDFLINVGFARTLIPFDSRMKKVFKQVWGITVSEERNYELIEDFFLSEVYLDLHITPSEFDRIIFQHTERVLEWAGS